jgi:hypothetical protein
VKSFKLMAAILLFIVSANSYASCDFATDIKENPDGTFTYQRGCHIEVGKRIKRLTLIEQQVDELEKVVELKDLALVKQKERTDLWRDTSLQINDKLQSYDSVANKSQWLYFGIGVAVTTLSVWAAGQLVR